MLLIYCCIKQFIGDKEVISLFRTCDVIILSVLSFFYQLLTLYFPSNKFVIEKVIDLMIIYRIYCNYLVIVHFLV